MFSVTRTSRPFWRNKRFAFFVLLFLITSFLCFLYLQIKSEKLLRSQEEINVISSQGYKQIYSQVKTTLKDVLLTMNKYESTTRNILNSVSFNYLEPGTTVTYSETKYFSDGSLQTHVYRSSTERPLGNQTDDTIFSRLKSTKVDCVKMIQGDKKAIEENAKLNSSLNVKNLYEDISGHCSEFIQKRKYIMSSLTSEEELFPIAFSLLVFKDAEQVERLLRAIYRPQNVYCVHIDDKSNSEFRETIRKLSSCFDNVFITKRSVRVIWGKFSVLEPEIICMEELLNYKKWKYFINLTGQEFPLRTNSELVKILKIYNGANDLEGTIKRANKGRWNVKKRPPPHGITPVKGSIHIVVNRQFVEYVIYNQTAKDFLEWTKHISVPDEAYFSSLNHNPQLKIPGSYTGGPEAMETKPFLTRFKNWYNGSPCHGKSIRGICVFGVGDLPLLTEKPHLFTNKFHLNYQPIALDCMEEFHYNRTRDEYYNKLIFNTSFYEKLEFIKHVIR